MAAADPQISDAHLVQLVKLQSELAEAKEKKDERERESLFGACEHLERCFANNELEDPLLALYVADVRNAEKTAELKEKVKANFFKHVKFSYLLRHTEAAGPAKKLSLGAAAFEPSFNAHKLRKHVWTFFEDAAEARSPKATMADVMAALATAMALCNKWGCPQATSTLLSQLVGVTSTCVEEWGIDVPTYMETMRKEIWSAAATALEGGHPLPSLHSKSTYTQLFAADAMAAQRKAQTVAAAASRVRESSSLGRDDRGRDRDRDRAGDRDRDRGSDRDRDRRGSGDSGSRGAHRSEPPSKKAKAELYLGSHAERLAAILRDQKDRKVNLSSICTNFNAAKGCTYSNCRFTHACLTCVKENRAEIDHSAGSSAVCK